MGGAGAGQNEGHYLWASGWACAAAGHFMVAAVEAGGGMRSGILCHKHNASGCASQRRIASRQAAACQFAGIESVPRTPRCDAFAFYRLATLRGALASRYICRCCRRIMSRVGRHLLPLTGMLFCLRRVT